MLSAVKKRTALISFTSPFPFFDPGCYLKQETRRKRPKRSLWSRRWSGKRRKRLKKEPRLCFRKRTPEPAPSAECSHTSTDKLNESKLMYSGGKKKKKKINPFISVTTPFHTRSRLITAGPSGSPFIAGAAERSSGIQCGCVCECARDCVSSAC